jgi:hypothetical protein
MIGDDSFVFGEKANLLFSAANWTPGGGHELLSLFTADNPQQM